MKGAKMPRVCVHLDRERDWDYARYLSGVGVESALVCLTCREHPDGIEANLREISPDRFAQIEEGGWWEWDAKAIIGRRLVLERSTNLTFQHGEIALVGAIPY